MMSEIYQKKLNRLRNKINQLDLEILRLLSMRFDAVRKVAQLKKEHCREITDSQRERDLLQTLETRNTQLPHPLPPRQLKKIFKTILDASKSLQKSILQGASKDSK